MADNYIKVLKDLKPDNLKPLYFIHGNEPYFVDSITDKILEIAIPEHEKGFNEFVFYGKDVSITDILSSARKFPMMAEKQLVLVREAHEIIDLGKKESQKMLESYTANPADSTILVLSFGKAQNEGRTWVKAFKTHGQIFNFKRLYDSALPGFISDLCGTKGLKIDPDAIRILAENIGNKLKTIDQEIDKIRINLKEGQLIDPEIIEKYVGISKEYNVFELQKVLVAGQVAKAFQIVNYFADNEKDHPLVMNVISLYNFFIKVVYLHGLAGKTDAEQTRLLGINPYFLRDYKLAAQVYNLGRLRNIIFALRRADAKSKGVNSGESSVKDIYYELILSFF